MTDTAVLPALLAARTERLTKAFAHEIPDRVPACVLGGSWSGHYAGHDVVATGYNYDALLDSFCRIAQDFPQMDGSAPATGPRPGPVLTAAASLEFSHFHTNGAPAPSVQHSEVAGILAVEEYPELIADPYSFIVTKQLPRRFRALGRSGAAGAMAMTQVGMLYAAYGRDAVGRIAGTLATSYGLPTIFKGSTEMAMDLLMDYFRGFRGISGDIRRHPQQVLDACEALHPLVLRRAAHGIPSGPFPGIFIPLHIATYLRPADFGRFYFPTFKRMVEDLVALDLTPILFMEGNWEPYYDFINELPKRKVVGLIETADFARAKRVVGDTLCIWGGMPVSVLNYSSRAEVVAYTRRLLDDLAPGGGYIFGVDKSLLAPNDANPENLAAALDTVVEHGRY